jgi:hypothetical protein
MTEADRHARVTALFLDALDQEPDARAAWLDTACADPALRQEVEVLLAHHDGHATGLLERPLLERHGTPGDGAHGDGADPLLGRQVGAWRVTGLLGRGGMGAVYRAERADDTFRQRAALKLVHPAFVADFRPRFLRERALLAGLDHPGVARLLDGGVADDGTPFLAMELVEGAPITTWAEGHALGARERVALFVQACEAVAYAHRSLVVHRDLKPDHVVVTESDTGAPRVKLLDFGVAKLLGDDGTDAALTRTGAGPMTPAYAAPEQLLGRPVTTATDTYALGVVLYELLAGRRPYDLAALTAAQVERVVSETVPPRPSEVAAPDQARALRGDLDVIVMKALAKEPALRYPTADALAADLRHWLDGLPVEARPATAAYRARRFVRRHRAGVLAASAVVVGMAALVAFYTARLKAERDRALEATRVAESETERAEAVADFLEGILRAPNTRWYVEGEAKGPDTPVRAVLDEAARRVDHDFADRPDLLADLHLVLGDTYGALGLHDESRRHTLRVLAIRESLYTPPHPKLAEALFYAAPLIRPGHVPTHVRTLERALAMLRARPGGNNFPWVIESLVAKYQQAGRYAEADALLEEGIVFVRTTFVPGHDGHRYRDRLLVLLPQYQADARLSLGDLGGAARSLATADSGFVRLPRTAAYYGMWRSQTCHRGHLLRLQGRPAESERWLLACWGTGPPRAPASPFPVDELLPAVTERGFREQASADLVPLYEAWSRPEAAAPYRADAARYQVKQDSLRALYREADAR